MPNFIFQEVDLLNQFYNLIGVTPDEDLNIIVLFLVGIIILMLLNNTLGTISKGLFGGYDR